MTCMPRAQNRSLGGLALAGLLVIGPGVSYPLAAQDPLGPTLLSRQPAEQPPPQVKSARGQAAAPAAEQLDARERRARIHEKRKAALEAQAERSKSRARLIEQKKASLRAEVEYHQARLARAHAELAIEEYEGCTLQQDLATVDGEILLAESDLSRSEDRTDWARRMFDKGFVKLAQKTSEELNLKKARFALEQAQAKRRVLVDYTKAKTIKELNRPLEKARSDELEKQQLWLRAKTDETELRRKVGGD
jgi:hypothetical protein